MSSVQPNLRHEPLRFRLRRFFSKPANLLLLIFLVALVVLSLLPMFTMLVNSVRWSESVAMAMESKGFCSTAPRSFS